MKKILILEDEADIRALLSKRLSSKGFKTLTAKDSFEGVKLLQGEKPDLVVLDLMLPAGGGLMFLKNLRKDPATAKIPVVVLTASQSPGYKHEVVAVGVEAYLEKPYDAEALLKVINNILNKTTPPPKRS